MTFKSGVSFRLKIFCKLKHLAIANAFKRNCFLKSIALRNHWHLSDDVLKALSIFQSTARRNLSHKLDSCFFVIFPSMSKGYFRSDDGMMPSEISFVYCAKHRLVKVHFHSLLQTFSINFTWGWIYFCFLSQTRLENICTTRDLFTFKLKRWRSGCEWQVAEISLVSLFLRLHINPYVNTVLEMNYSTSEWNMMLTRFPFLKFPLNRENASKINAPRPNVDEMRMSHGSANILLIWQIKKFSRICRVSAFEIYGHPLSVTGIEMKFISKRHVRFR